MPARAVQLERPFRCPAVPTMHIDEIHAVASTASSDMNCILEAYASLLEFAVPECTQARRLDTLCTSAQIVVSRRARIDVRRDSELTAARKPCCSSSVQSSCWSRS